MEDEKTGGNGKGVFGAALLGVALGAVAGVLLAPKAGEETRKELAEMAEKMKDDISDRIKKLGVVSKSAYKEIVDVVVHQYEDTKQITGDQAKKLRDELSAGFDRVKETVNDQDIPEIADKPTKKK